MKRPALRVMLLAPLALLLSAGALALGVYVERNVAQDLVAAVDEELLRAGGPGRARGAPRGPGQARADDLGVDDGNDTGLLAPLEFIISNGIIEVSSADSDNLDESTLLPLEDTTGNHTVGESPRYRVVAIEAPDGATRIVALSLAQVDESLASLHRNLIVGGIALLALQVVAVWLIAGAVARPVTRMSRVAHEIADGDLDATVGPPSGSRETAELGADLSRMLATLNTTIAEQEQSAADANQARAEMQRFMSDASHELRTPLTALKGYSDLYGAGMLDAEGLDRAMDRIGSESERLTRLVLGLLDLTRHNDAERTAVDLQATVATVVDDLAAAYPDRSITSTAIAACNPRVCGDADRLHQAVVNLVSNACQHTAAPQPIEVLIEATSSHVDLAVVDHGPGVDPSEAEQLFAPFARGDASRSRKSHNGAGLGLALVRHIAADHNGKAWVKETPGGGATFGITLPLHNDERSRFEEPKPTVSPDDA